MEADREEMKDEIGVGQEKVASLVPRIDANQAETDVNLKEIREATKSGQAEMNFIVSAVVE
jgi:predicted  nucleic acid-binding Zn-ribbon protein